MNTRTCTPLPPGLRGLLRRARGLLGGLPCSRPCADEWMRSVLTGIRTFDGLRPMECETAGRLPVRHAWAERPSFPRSFPKKVLSAVGAATEQTLTLGEFQQKACKTAIHHGHNGGVSMGSRLPTNSPNLATSQEEEHCRRGQNQCPHDGVRIDSRLGNRPFVEMPRQIRPPIREIDYIQDDMTDHARY